MKDQRTQRDGFGRSTTTYAVKGNPTPLPSDTFDWELALTLNAITFRDLGYTLTPQQKARIKHHEKH